MPVTGNKNINPLNTFSIKSFSKYFFFLLFSLTTQMKRASDSISLNIAEGSTGQSNPEQIKFLGYAQRSAIEVVNCLYLAIRRKYIDQLIFDKFYNELDKLVAQIQAFKNSLK